MNTLTRRTLLVAPALLIALLWWQFMWVGRANEVSAAEQQTELVSAESVAIRSQVMAAEKFRDSGQAGIDQFDALQAALPATDDVAGFIREHEALATQWGVQIESLSPGSADSAGSTRQSKKTGTPAGLRSVPMAVTVTGTDSAVADYLLHLRDLERANSIESFSLTQEGSGSVSADLQLNLYRTTS